MKKKNRMKIARAKRSKTLPKKSLRKKLSLRRRSSPRRNRRNLMMKSLSALFKKWVSTLQLKKRPRKKFLPLIKLPLPLVKNPLPRRRRKRRRQRRQKKLLPLMMWRLKSLLRWLKSKRRPRLRKLWKSAPAKMKSTAKHQTWAPRCLKLKPVPRTRKSDFKLSTMRKWIRAASDLLYASTTLEVVKLCTKL